MSQKKPMDERHIPQKTEKVVLRKILDEILVFPLEDRGDRNYCYSLNSTAAAFIELIDGKRSLGEIKRMLQEQYEVSDQELDQDMSELTAFLQEIQAIA